MLLSKYTRGSNFLRYAMGQFPPEKMIARCEAHGLPLKVEKDMRVFPVSNKSEDVINMFEKIYAAHPDLSVHTRTSITQIKKEENQFILTTKDTTYTADIVVFTTGGNAFAHTGSTGDGYTFAQELGHTITKLGPSLNSFHAREDRCATLSGISFPNSSLHFFIKKALHRDRNLDFDQNQEIQSLSSVQHKLNQDKNLSSKNFMPVQLKKIIWPMIFTHFGISWPATFSMSSQLAFETIDAEHGVSIHVQPDADKDFNYRNDFLTRECNSSANARKHMENILRGHFPERFVGVLCEIAGIESTLQVAHCSKEKRVLLARLLGEGLPLTLIGRRAGDEFVTAGGICTDEVDSKTMASKLVPWVFCAGEILDVDGVTGGFNFQAAWATGRCAAKGIVDLLKS